MIAVRATDKRIACDEEFSDSEDEGEGGRRNAANHKKGSKRPRVDEDKREGEEKKAGRYSDGCSVTSSDAMMLGVIQRVLLLCPPPPQS